MTDDRLPLPGRAERWVLTLLVIVFRAAVACLAAGVAWWLASPASGLGGALLTAGLFGLLSMPLLRLLAILAAAARARDRVTLAATLAVMAILFALTIRDAARS